MATRRVSERGLALPVVLAITLLASILLAALLGYVRVNLAAGRTYQDRIDEVQASDDVLQFAFNAIRNDNSLGVEGHVSSWTYGGVTATCTGLPGSGVHVSGGRTDRTVECIAPKVKGAVRYFDRSGAANSVVTEQLTWVVSD